MDNLVAYLGIFAFGSFAAALTPSLAIGLNWEGGSVWAARTSMLLGIVSVICLEVTDRCGYYNLLISPAALALTLSLLSFLLVSALAPRHQA
jgi:Na+/pantothenate symporter